jgi:hypothetical protein
LGDDFPTQNDGAAGVLVQNGAHQAICLVERAGETGREFA